MQWVAPSEKDAATDTLEKRLWDAADQFRANSGLSAAQYSQPVLGLIFLRFAEARFAKQRAVLEKTAASSRRGSLIRRAAKAFMRRLGEVHIATPFMTTDGSDPATWFNIPARPAAPFCERFLNYGGKDARLRVIPAVRKKLQSNPNGVYLNCTTFGRKAGSQRLSPFRLGPCCLYGGITSQNMENAWQYSKVFKPFVGTDGKPTAEYFEWAKKGWSSWKARRHPMGDATESVFHWWDGHRLDEVEARKQIYVPLYVEQVVKERNFHILKSIWEEDIKPDAGSTLYLMDYDAYEYGTMSFSQVLNNPAKSMGHGFVLAMLLTNDAALQECELR